MKPKEEIINKIEGLKRGVMLYNKITETDLKEWYMLNGSPRGYQSAFGKIKALDKAISIIKSFLKDYELIKSKDNVIIPKKLFKSTIGLAKGFGILEAEDKVKEFLKNYALVKKEDLLTDEEYEHLGECEIEDCSKCELLARRHYRFRKSLVKNIKEKGE